MKKKYLAVEFIAVLVFLVLPPFFARQVPRNLDAQKSWNFFVFIELLIAFAVELQFFFCRKNKEDRTKKRFKAFFYIPLCTGLLFISLALINLLQLVFHNAPEPYEIFLEKSLCFSDVFFLLFNFFCAAFYEEAVYRHFLPEVLAELLPQKKAFGFFTELSALLLFAFSHKSGGLYSIINACLCALILRFCFVKNGNIVSGTASHFIYNIVLLAFALLI